MLVVVMVLVVVVAVVVEVTSVVVTDGVVVKTSVDPGAMQPLPPATVLGSGALLENPSMVAQLSA